MFEHVNSLQKLIATGLGVLMQHLLFLWTSFCFKIMTTCKWHFICQNRGSIPLFWNLDGSFCFQIMTTCMWHFICQIIFC